MQSVSKGWWDVRVSSSLNINEDLNFFISMARRRDDERRRASPETEEWTQATTPDDFNG